MDWSEKNACIKCNNGGTLLVCSENGCPIAVHEGCLGCPAKFDNSGCFYCPYCLYKQAVAESRRAREYALARKKALMEFMDEKVIGGEKHIREKKTFQENGDHNQSKNSEANASITSDGGKSKSNNDGTTDQPVLLDEEENIRDSAGSEGEDPSLEMIREKINRIEEDSHEEEEHETSAQKQIQEDDHESSAEEKIQEEERETTLEEEKTQEENRKTSSASTDEDPSLIGHERAKRGSKRSKQVEKDSDDDKVRSKRLKQHDKKKQASMPVTPTRRSSRKSSVPTRIEKVSEKEVGSPRRLRKSEQPLVKLASDAFGSSKRKRLMWTEKEEEALRAGVERYSNESKNLPWRNILDNGKFDSTRTPADLKDKWRNMTGK